jgi:pteridine reductase
MSWALVTGAGVRVGRAIARGLAEEGFDVICHANTSSLADTVTDVERAGRKAVALRGNLAEMSELVHLADMVKNELVEDGHALDVVVHNAGVFEKVEFGDVSLAAFRRMMGVNLEAPFFLTQELLPALAPEACVIFLADILAERCPPGYAHYMASKAGLVALTRSLAVEIAPHRVNAIAPGTVAFPADMDARARASIVSKIPAGREGRPEDIARAVNFLARSPFVSGQVIAVDGGRDAVH